MTHTYAFVGLTPSERSLLESIFALDADVDPGEALVPVRLSDGGEGADLLIVNGDDLSVVEQLRTRYPNALLVLVGQPAGATEAPWPVMRRPLDLHGAVNVLSELDWPESGLDGAAIPRRATPRTETHPSEEAAPSSYPPSSRAAPSTYPSEDMSSAFAPTTVTAPLTMGKPIRAEQPLSARMAWAVSEVAPTEIAEATRPALVEDPVTPDAPQEVGTIEPLKADILLVHGRQGGRTPGLADALQAEGYAVKTVASVNAALVAMARHPSCCVLLEQYSLGDQWVALARSLSATRSATAPPLHLAVVARSDSMFERLRARRLGCTWMKAPIDLARLVTYLERRGVPRAGNPGRTA